MELLDIIKALGDENRLRILNILKYGRLCVCEIEYILGITQSNASRHLTKLKNARLIESEKSSKWVYYKIRFNALDRFDFLKSLIETEFCKITSFQRDIDNLNKYKNSDITCEDLRAGKYNIKKECKI